MIYETTFHVAEPEAIETITLRNPVLGEVVAALSILSPQQVSDLLTGLRARTFKKAGIDDPKLARRISTTCESFNMGFLPDVADSLEICLERILIAITHADSAAFIDKDASQNLREIKTRLSHLLEIFNQRTAAKQSVNIAPVTKDDDLVELTTTQLENMRAVDQRGQVFDPNLHRDTLPRGNKYMDDNDFVKLIKESTGSNAAPFLQELNKERELFEAARLATSLESFPPLIEGRGTHPAFTGDYMWFGWLLAKGFIQSA